MGESRTNNIFLERNGLFRKNLVYISLLIYIVGSMQIKNGYIICIRHTIKSEENISYPEKDISNQSGSSTTSDREPQQIEFGTDYPESSKILDYGFNGKDAYMVTCESGTVFPGGGMICLHKIEDVETNPKCNDMTHIQEIYRKSVYEDYPVNQFSFSVNDPNLEGDLVPFTVWCKEPNGSFGVVNFHPKQEEEDIPMNNISDDHVGNKDEKEEKEEKDDDDDENILPDDSAIITGGDDASNNANKSHLHTPFIVATLCVILYNTQ